jgi:hypothetical protein
MQLIEKIKAGKIGKEEKLMLKLIGDTFLKTSIEQFKKLNDKDSNR